jgi:hypothetical protein
MTMVITATSATTATVSITGSATEVTASAFDVANLTITWLNTAIQRDSSSKYHQLYKV